MTINNFHKGQSLTPYVSNGAFYRCKNLDIIGQPGMARINYLPILAGSPTSLLDSYAVDSAGTVYVAGGGKAYTLNLAGSITDITGTAGGASAALSIGFWEGKMFSTITNYLKYSTLVAPDTWASFDTASLTTTNFHNIFVSNWDGNMYIANAGTIARLVKVGAIFDPTNAATYSWTASAFTLPKGYFARGISEIDNYLVISAYISSSYKTTYFFWNRADTTSEFIYELDEPGITSMTKVGRVIYATGGKRGNIYKIGLFGVQPFNRIPYDYDNAEQMVTYGGDANCSGMAWWNNKLMVGVGNNVAAGSTFNCGMYAVDENSVHHAHTISAAKDGSDILVNIGVVGTYADKLFYAWKTTDATPTSTYGIDVVSFDNNRPTTYGCYIESNFYPVGLFNEKKSFDHIEVQLARPLQTGEGIIIKYRTNINDSWTTLGTQTFATNGAVNSLFFPGIHNVQNIQIRIELTTGAASKNTPYLKEVHLI